MFLDYMGIDHEWARMRNGRNGRNGRDGREVARGGGYWRRRRGLPRGDQEGDLVGEEGKGERMKDEGFTRRRGGAEGN